MKRLKQMVVITVLLVSPLVLLAQSNVVDMSATQLEAFAKRVMEQWARENNMKRDFKQHYSYTRTRLTEYLHADGSVKRRDEKVDERKPDPAPAVKQPAATKPNANSDTRTNLFDSNDFALNQELLNRFDYNVVRREILNGRPTLVADFKAKSGKLPERNLKDRFINHSAGRIWVDEAEYKVAKIHLHLTERVTVFGGLAGAVWKFNYFLERTRTEDGLWYGGNENWYVEGREVVISQYRRYHEQWTNVRKTQ